MFSREILTDGKSLFRMDCGHRELIDKKQKPVSKIDEAHNAQCKANGEIRLK